MKRGRLLTVGALGVSLALCGVASPTLGATPVATSKPTVSSIFLPAASCSYPPVRTPTLALASSVTSVKSGVAFQLGGKLTLNSCGVKNWLIGLYSSTQPNGNYKLDATTLTNSLGQYAFTVKQSTTRSYRTVSVAGLGYNSAVSNTVTVTKK